jgi:hypothetical protein
LGGVAESVLSWLIGELLGEMLMVTKLVLVLMLMLPRKVDPDRRDERHFLSRDAFFVAAIDSQANWMVGKVVGVVREEVGVAHEACRRGKTVGDG